MGQPSFFILDGAAPDGRDGLSGFASSTGARWWECDFGRMYTLRDGAWGQEPMSDDAPVSIAYRHAHGKTPRGWLVLGARGTLIEHAGTTKVAKLGVRGTLRRIRMIGTQAVAVGAHGQVFRGRGLALAPLPGLLDERVGRYLLDVVGRGDDDLAVVGRRGEVFHWDGERWASWSVGGGDLHVAAIVDGELFVGGDGPRILRRVRDGWRPVSIAADGPVVGLCGREGTLWAGTPTSLFAGDARVLAPAIGPGFGGQLLVGDGVLYCFGVVEMAAYDGRAWAVTANPDQHDRSAVPWPVLGDSLDAAIRGAVDPAADLAGRLYDDDDIGKTELARWAKLSVSPGRVREMLADPGMYRVLEVEGDLHVRGDLATFERKLVGLVVHGDLIVDGVFSDSDHPQTMTLVGGSLRAKTIITSGELEVAGSVTCEHLIGDYNDFGATLRGAVRARLFWPEYHAFHLATKPAFELCIGDAAARVNREMRSTIEVATPAQLRRLRPELLRGEEDDELEADRKAVLAALRGGRTIWTDAPAKKPPARRPSVSRSTAKQSRRKKPPARK